MNEKKVVAIQDCYYGMFTVFIKYKSPPSLIKMERSLKPSPAGKMVKLFTFGNYDILAKTRSGKTTAITFSRQNDTGSRVLVIVLVSESKAL